MFIDVCDSPAEKEKKTFTILTIVMCPQMFYSKSTAGVFANQPTLYIGEVLQYVSDLFSTVCMHRKIQCLMMWDFFLVLVPEMSIINHLMCSPNANLNKEENY